MDTHSQYLSTSGGKTNFNKNNYNKFTGKEKDEVQLRFPTGLKKV